MKNYDCGNDDITDILLKVVLNTTTTTLNQRTVHFITLLNVEIYTNLDHLWGGFLGECIK